MPATKKVEQSEWIVEALLPARQVEFTKTPASQARPSRIVSKNASDRETRLQELFDYLSSKLKAKPVLLRAAGAISVTASPEEIGIISNHPLIKRIGPNRRRRT